MSASLGIDIGYGYTKTYDGASYNLFRTAVISMSAKPPSKETTLAIVNGEEYLVGKKAEKCMLQTMIPNFVASKPWLAVLSHALKLNDFRTGTIVLGLPPGVYTSAYKETIVDSIKKSNLIADGMKLKFRSDDNPENNIAVIIIPQGAGIYFSHIMNHPEDMKKDIVVFDVGYHMMNITMFSEGKYVDNIAESIMLGVSVMLEEIKKAYLREYRMLVCDDDAIKAFTNGENACFKQNIPPISMNTRFYVDQVISVIQSYIYRLHSTPHIILMGGGAVIILKGMLDIGYPFQLVDRPQYANAVGYWLYAYQNHSR